MMSIDFESLTLREIIRLQNQLSTCLARRFEKWLAIIFSDIVGSTAYFQRYGEQAGRQIHQQHLDLLAATLEGSDGRIVDTARDGALLAFPRIEDATEFSIRLHRARWHAHRSTLPEHRWQTRTCIHLRAVSENPTVVNGINLRKGEQAAVGSGARVHLSEVMTLTFEAEEVPSAPQDLTLPHQRSL